MRISDWSSDVCSSDLPVRVVTVVGVRVQLDARVEIPADQQYLLFCPQHRVARGAEIVGGIDHDRMALRKGDGRAIPAWFEQIGRASWRERVCQYVQISVVDVSLQKTKNIVPLITTEPTTTTETIHK